MQKASRKGDLFMKVKIVGKNIDITESMRDVITEKVKKLEKYSKKI